MNRAVPRSGMVVADVTPRCPRCGERLGFGSDRDGRLVQGCECGYRDYVPRRSGRVARTPEDEEKGPAAAARASSGWDTLMRSVGLRGDPVTR